jgi:DNA polymerase-4
MPMAEALRRAPGAVVVPPRHRRYAEASEEAFAIFRRFTPLVEPLSLDEAFLDVTASRTLFGDGEAIARAIKDAIRGELGLTASAGVAPSKFVAKIASDLRKPDGLVIVLPADVADFLRPLPIERMWGVGPKTAVTMHAMGIHTLGDLARTSASRLARSVGQWGSTAVQLARGDDDRDVVPDALARSIGAEMTYEEDLSGAEAIGATMLAHAARVARRLLRAELWGRTVQAKVKFSDFSVRARSTTLDDPVQDTDAIHRAALDCLARVPLEGRRVRLTGISVSHLETSPPAPTLFRDPSSEKRHAIEEVTARIADRYGDEHAVTRASLVNGRR